METERKIYKYTSAIAYILLCIIAYFLMSCSTDDVCNCEKETYENITEIITKPNGLPTLTVRKNILSKVEVVCQQEVKQQNNGDGTLFNINCY